MDDRAERVLLVHAHPDDESITTGATIADLCARGATVTVLTCTRGELGEIIPAELRGLDPAALAAVREGELRDALTALSVSDHLFLGSGAARWEGWPERRYRDSGMRWGAKGAEPLDPVDPESLTAAEIDEVAADIAAVILSRTPDLVISYAADGGYGHPDHVRAHDAARTAAQVMNVPFYVVDSPGARPGPVRVSPAPGSPALSAKRAALAAHRTQVTVDADSFALSSGPARPFATPETFTRLRPARSGFHGQGAFTRIAALVASALFGAFAGVVLTAAHQATVVVGTLIVPWGIVTGLVVTALLLVGLRMVFETRLMAGCAAVGLLAASALLSVRSVGGSVLVPANLAGYAWTFGPVLIAGVVLAWPRIRRGLPARAAV